MRSRIKTLVESWKRVKQEFFLKQRNVKCKKNLENSITYNIKEMRRFTIHTKKILEIEDLEELLCLADEVIVDLRHSRYLYDEEGHYVWNSLSLNEREEHYVDMVMNAETDNLNFRDNKNLRNISYEEAVHFPLRGIKEEYIGHILPKARGILRRDEANIYDRIVSADISDDYLDNLLALCWKEQLMRWIYRWKIEED